MAITADTGSIYFMIVWRSGSGRVLRTRGAPQVTRAFFFLVPVLLFIFSRILPLPLFPAQDPTQNPLFPAPDPTGMLCLLGFPLTVTTFQTFLGFDYLALERKAVSQPPLATGEILPEYGDPCSFHRRL